MVENFKVSVIVPVYGVEKYLDRCLQSVCSQTYRNLEIIVVDDGSPDNCPQMCEDWKSKDSRIKVVHKVNGGLGSARNAGLDVMTGDLVGFVDSDDWCEPTMFEHLVACYEKTHAPIVVCDVLVDWENGWPTEVKSFGRKDVYTREEMLSAFFKDEIENWMWNKLYECSLWDNLRFKAQLYEDIPVFRRMMESVSGIAFTHSAEYHYVQRQGSIVNARINERHFVQLDEMIANAELAKEMMPECLNHANASVVEVCYALLSKSIVQNEFQSKYDEWSRLIRENESVIPQITMFGKADMLILKAISHGKPYRSKILALNALKKVYFSLNLKKLVSKVKH